MNININVGNKKNIGRKIKGVYLQNVLYVCCVLA